MYYCDPECINGQCTSDNKCQCDYGWGGSSCNKPADHCVDDPKGLVCLNGSICRKNYDMFSTDKYYCDCNHDKSYPSTTVYAGRSCEYTATVFCMHGVPKSNFAFCVNGGVCKDILYGATDNPHAFRGCNCPNDFTGNHCEIPTHYKSYQSVSTRPKSSSNSSNESKYVISPFIVLYVLLISFSTFVVIAAILFKVLRALSKRKREIATADDRDLHIEADGEVLQDAIESMEMEKEVEDQVKQLAGID